jgi:hypothetical protein
MSQIFEVCNRAGEFGGATALKFVVKHGLPRALLAVLADDSLHDDVSRRFRDVFAISNTFPGIIEPLLKDS